MHIPSAAVPLPSSTLTLPVAFSYSSNHDSSDSPPQKWSSAIGIITAICGNVLISFALNTQRYAHLRISRDWNEQEEKLKLKRRPSKPRPKRASYGATSQQQKSQDHAQLEAAGERARLNAQADTSDYTLLNADESNESDPLIPSVDSLDRKKSSGSSSKGRKRQGEESESNDDEEEDENKRKSYLRSPIWWAGIVMMTLGETGNFLAYGFAPASIVSPLGVVALVSNCLVAPWLLHERFRWRDALGVVIAVSGCVTVVFSASTSNPKLNPDKIWHLITQWEFELYFGITVVLIIGLAIASNRFGGKSILIDLGLMGLFGGYTALSTKGVASLLSNTVWKVVTFPITYLLVAVLVFSAIMQIKYVNRALQRFNSTQVIPTQFVLFTLSVIIGSAILYRDFERTSTEDAIKFVAGCALTFLGVWCITAGRSNESEGDDEETSDDEEEAIDLVDEEGVQPEIREREDFQGRRHSLIATSSTGPKFDIVDAPLPNEPANVPPAQAAAVHSDSAAETSDPSKDIKSPPPLHATTSDIAVPTIEVSSNARPKTPLKRGHSAIDSPRKDSPTTPALSATRPGDLLDPNAAQRLVKRNSSNGFVPGPLTSPLSSSLSAIVADSLRRGVDHYPSTSLRRHARAKPSLGRRPGAEIISPNAAPRKRHSIASGEMVLDGAAADDDQETGHLSAAAAEADARPGRMRSLSATLGDIFGTPKRRRMGTNEDVRGRGPQQQRPQEGVDDEGSGS